MFLQTGLLCWYIASLYIVYCDNTVSLCTKIAMEVVNIAVLGFIATNMFNDHVSNILYYVIGALLIAWYIYFTPQDWNNTGYTKLERYVYVSIDIITLLYLFTSLILSYLVQTHNQLNVIKSMLNIKQMIWNFCNFF